MLPYIMNDCTLVNTSNAVYEIVIVHVINAGNRRHPMLF